MLPIRRAGSFAVQLPSVGAQDSPANRRIAPVHAGGYFYNIFKGQRIARLEHGVRGVEPDDLGYELRRIEVPVRFRLRHIALSLIQIKERVLLRLRRVRRNRECRQGERKIIYVVRMPGVAQHYRKVDVYRFLAGLNHGGLLDMKLLFSARFEREYIGYDCLPTGRLVGGGGDPGV